MLQLTRQRHHTYKNNYHDKYFFGEILTIYIFHKKTRKAFKKTHSNNKKNKNRYFVSKHLTGKQTSKQTTRNYFTKTNSIFFIEFTLAGT